MSSKLSHEEGVGMKRLHHVMVTFGVAALVTLLVVGPVRAQEGTPAAVASPAAVLTVELLWDSHGGPEPFSSPYGLAVAPDGTLWVADGNNARFRILAPDGTFRETWGQAGTADGQFDFKSTFSSGSGGQGAVAFDEAGNI
jgi:hypothetical protein